MSERNLIALEPGLPQIQGWASLSEVDKKWLQEKTSNIKNFASQEFLAALNIGIELWEIRDHLRNTSFSLKEYLGAVWGSAAWTKARRRMKTVDDILGLRGWDISKLREFCSKAPVILSGGAGLQLGETRNLLMASPAPGNKPMEAYIEKEIKPALTEYRSGKVKGKTFKINKEYAQRLMFQKVDGITRNTKGLHTSADFRDFLKPVFCWLMERNAIPGEMKITRTSIPEGTIAQVGRPRKRRREKPE